MSSINENGQKHKRKLVFLTDRSDTKRPKVEPNAVCIEKATKKKHIIYVGNVAYEIARNDSEIFLLNTYIKYVLDNAVHFLSSKYNFRITPEIYCEIILQMFTAILKKNGFYIEDRIKYKVLSLNLLMPELVFKIADTIYFNKYAIDKFVQDNHNILIQPVINYSAALKNTQVSEQLMLKNEQRPIDSNSTITLFSLFAIADHFAQHYLDIEQTDYIYHENFGTSYYTLHSKLELVSIDTTKLSQEPLSSVDLNF